MWLMQGSSDWKAFTAQQPLFCVQAGNSTSLWNRHLLLQTPLSLCDTGINHNSLRFLATRKCHRDWSHCRLPHHQWRLSAKYHQIQSSAAVLRLEWHRHNFFSTTHSESVPVPSTEYKDCRDCTLIIQNGSLPCSFSGVRDTAWTHGLENTHS